MPSLLYWLVHLDLNTSNVNVNPLYYIYANKLNIDLNTSNVNVNLNDKEVGKKTIEFKYIQC